MPEVLAADCLTVDPTLPIDPSRPMCLEDGTPVEIVNGPITLGSGAFARTVVQVQALRRPTGRYASSSGVWWHNVATGEWDGNSDYLKLRNVAADAIEPEDIPIAPVSISFEIRSGLVGTDRTTWGTVAEGFPDGKAAAAWVAQHKAQYAEAGKSLHIVKREVLPEPIDWRARELSRFDSGEYVKLPADWHNIIHATYPDHYAHIASSDKRKIAFTETEASGERDRQKVLSASEYAKRFFDNLPWPICGTSSKEQFVSDMLGSSTNVLFAPLGDADAMERVYLDCGKSGCDEVHSCMTHGKGDYVGGRQFGLPVRVYAMGGDITVAFLRASPDSDDYSECDLDATWDSDGDIIARCLVWPERKQYARVYGECTAARVLRTALEAQGYRDGNLDGAKIARVACEQAGSNAYVMPYLDIGDGTVSDCGDYFTVGNGEIYGNQTSGVCYIREMTTCERCDDSVPEDETVPVYVSRDDAEQWCNSCRAYHSYYSDTLNQYISSHDATTYRANGRHIWGTQTVAEWELEANGGTLPGLWVESHDEWREDAFVCEDCGETFAGTDRADCGGDDVCENCNDTRDEQIVSPSLPLSTAA